MRIFTTLLLPLSEIIDFICDNFHYPFLYALIYFVLSQPWRPEYQPPPVIDDGLPKKKERDYQQLLDRLTGDTTTPLNDDGKPSPDNPHVEEQEPTKKPLPLAQDAAQDLICPLTLELPFDPVTAEDGHIYERAALEDYLQNTQTILCSPVTCQPMGPRFLPAPQYKKMIETLIKSGILTGTLVEKWDQRALHHDHLQDMLHMAQQGVVMEMLAVACNYLVGDGEYFQQDAQVAFEWFEKAHLAGSPIGTAGVGLLLTRGVGTDKNVQKGLDYLLQAGKGSDFASYMLGLAYADGKLLGVPPNPAEAGVWLQRCLSNTYCAQRHMTLEDKCLAQQKLEEVLQRQIKRNGLFAT